MLPIKIKKLDPNAVIPSYAKRRRWIRFNSNNNANNR
jgi:hypothetical protein